MLRQIKEPTIKKSTILSLILLYFVIVLIFSLIVTTSGESGWISDDDNNWEDEDENGIDDDVEDYNEREIQIEVEEDQVEIQSKRKNETLEDKIEISFKVSDEPEFQLDYRSESDSLDSELSFEVAFHSLIEFNDTNGNEIFDYESDQEIQVYELETDYTTISHEISDDAFGNVIHRINTTSVDGVFSLQFYIVSGFSNISGGVVVPSEIKLDLAIRNYPFLESTSKLALYTVLDAENEFEVDEETEDEEKNLSSNEKEVDMSKGNFTSFFSWYEYASVDGINQTVYNSNIESDESENEKVYIIYERGSLIIHDPKLGFENVTKLEIPFISPEVIFNILSVLAIPKEEYLLPVIILTTIMVPTAWLLYRKNQV